MATTASARITEEANVREFGKTAFTQLQLVLTAGFALLIVLLGFSAWLGIDAIRDTESAAKQLLGQQRTTLRLIEDIQQEQDSLSEIFYSLAVDQSPANRDSSRQKLDRLQMVIRNTLATGMASPQPEHWSDVNRAVVAFVQEGRRVIESGQRPGVAFFRNHEDLIGTLGKLIAVNFDTAAAAEKERARVASGIVKTLLWLVSGTLVIALLGAFFTVRIATRMFRQLQWQESELDRLSSRTMADQEATARRFSRELHDEFGQTLNAVEANLVSMQHARQYNAERVDDALAVIKVAIGNARELSQLLRPSILDDFGLDTSLAWLSEGFSQRTGILVEYVCSGVPRLDSDTETQLFRIAQEALTNVARHADATLVRLELESLGPTVCLTITDNGQGMLPSANKTGLGLVGMRARSRAIAGSLSVSSAPGKGVTIRAEVRIKEISSVAQNSNHPGR